MTTSFLSQAIIFKIILIPPVQTFTTPISIKIWLFRLLLKLTRVAKFNFHQNLYLYKLKTLVTILDEKMTRNWRVKSLNQFDKTIDSASWELDSQLLFVSIDFRRRNFSETRSEFGLEGSDLLHILHGLVQGEVDDDQRFLQVRKIPKNCLVIYISQLIVQL